MAKSAVLFTLGNVDFCKRVIRNALTPEKKEFQHIVPETPYIPALCGLDIDEHGHNFETWQDTKDSSKPLCPGCIKALQKIRNDIDEFVGD